jgi:hypothetical protein
MTEKTKKWPKNDWKMTEKWPKNDWNFRKLTPIRLTHTTYVSRFTIFNTKKLNSIPFTTVFAQCRG